MGNSHPHWKFQGLCMTVLYLVPARRVRSLVPRPLEVTEVFSGLTLGGIYAARYDRGDSGASSEFGILPAYVSYGGKKGFYMHNFCVDCEETVKKNGRRVWSADKTVSEFNWEISEKWISLEVAQGGSPVISVRMKPVINTTPITAVFPILCVKGNSVVFLKNRYASNVGISTSTVSIPEGSPLKGFPFMLKLISTFWDASNVVHKEPEFIHETVIKAPEKALGTPIGKQM